MGVFPKNLPVHIIETFTDEEGSDTEEYGIEWILDGDQYPITLNIKEKDSEYTHFNAFWE